MAFLSMFISHISINSQKRKKFNKKTFLNTVVDHHVAVEIEEEQKVGQPQNSEDPLDNMDPNIVLKARENCAD